MSPKIASLQNIPNGKAVRVFLPIQSKAERYRVGCILEKNSDTKFNLLFKPGVLPADAVDKTQTCLISVDMGGPNLSLEAKINKIENTQTLNMTVVKSISHEQMREFFRVDATTSVISSSFQPEFFNEVGEPWELKGKTVDISGSGILAIFKEKPPADSQVNLKITLPTNEPEVISVLAFPVRIQKLEEDLYEVAYHFNEITPEDRDKIIGCCLVIQRRLLRLKVQVKDGNKL